MSENPFHIPPPPPGTPTVSAKPAAVDPAPILGIPAVPASPTVSGDSATHRISGLPRRLPAAPPTAPPQAVAPAPPVQPAIAPVSRAWQLSFADGQQLSLDGVLLVGRNPATREPWPDAQMVAVVDPQKTVSKTHAAFELTADGVLLHDLDSTNGVIVRGEHGEKLVSPGHPQLISDTATAHLGEFSVRLNRR